MTAQCADIVDWMIIRSPIFGHYAHKVHRLKTLVSAHAPASLLGDHSVSAPPDPIPNSTVKPDRADGTIAQALEE